MPGLRLAWGRGWRGTPRSDRPGGAAATASWCAARDEVVRAAHVRFPCPPRCPRDRDPTGWNHDPVPLPHPASAVPRRGGRQGGAPLRSACRRRAGCLSRCVPEIGDRPSGAAPRRRPRRRRRGHPVLPVPSRGAGTCGDRPPGRSPDRDPARPRGTSVVALPSRGGPRVRDAVVRRRARLRGRAARRGTRAAAGRSRGRVLRPSASFVRGAWPLHRADRTVVGRVPARPPAGGAERGPARRPRRDVRCDHRTPRDPFVATAGVAHLQRRHLDRDGGEHPGAAASDLQTLERTTRRRDRPRVGLDGRTHERRSRPDRAGSRLVVRGPVGWRRRRALLARLGGREPSTSPFQAPAARGPSSPRTRVGARAALRAGAGARSSGSRRSRALAARVAGSPLGRVAFRDRFRVVGEDPLLDAVAAALGDGPIAFAAAVRRPGPFRKPVLQAVTPDGRVVAYAKVAWNDVTAANVGAEHAALTALATRRAPGASRPDADRAARASRVPGAPDAADARDAPALRRRRRPPPAPVSRAVAALRLASGSEHDPIGVRLRARFAAAPAPALPHVTQAVGALLDGLRLRARPICRRAPGTATGRPGTWDGSGRSCGPGTGSTAAPTCPSAWICRTSRSSDGSSPNARPCRRRSPRPARRALPRCRRWATTRRRGRWCTRSTPPRCRCATSRRRRAGVAANPRFLAGAVPSLRAASDALD